MKVIYLFLRRHCYSYDSELWGFDAYCKLNIDIEVWSCVNWTFSNCDIPKNISNENYVYYINNKTQLIDNLKRLKNEKCYFLIYPYGLTLQSMECIKYIKKYGFSFSNITESLECSTKTYKKNVEFNLLIIIALFIKKVILDSKHVISLLIKGKPKASFNAFLLSWKNFIYPFIYKSEYNFLSTKLLYNFYPNIFEFFSKRNILVHSNDYAKWIKINKKNVSNNNNKIVVFIDQYSAGHSDFIKLGLRFPVMDAYAYYNKLCKLFSLIEKKYDCEVVIAAHPKAEYKGDEFDNRKIIYNQTSQLIKESEFVIIQTSTCFSQIVLFQKKFLQIYDKVFFENQPYVKNLYIATKNIFDCSQLDISERITEKNLSEYLYDYNEKTYSQYLNRFVISNESTFRDKLFNDVIREKILLNK